MPRPKARIVSGLGIVRMGFLPQSRRGMSSGVLSYSSIRPISDVSCNPRHLYGRAAHAGDSLWGGPESQ